MHVQLRHTNQPICMRGKLEHKYQVTVEFPKKESDRRRARARDMQLHGKLSSYYFLISLCYMLGHDW